MAEFLRAQSDCLGLLFALHAVLGRAERIVTIRTASEAGFSVLEVGDTGCGIAGEDLPRVFTPFFSRKGEWAAAGSAQGSVKGAGLSLAVSHAGVAAYGGRMELHSVAGTGSRFTVYLPHATGTMEDAAGRSGA